MADTGGGAGDMTAVPRRLIARWQQTVAEHPRRWCPKCGQRRCWEQAYAREQLIVNGLPMTPPEVDRPQQTAGGARRTA